MQDSSGTGTTPRAPKEPATASTAPTIEVTDTAVTEPPVADVEPIVSAQLTVRQDTVTADTPRPDVPDRTGRRAALERAATRTQLVEVCHGEQPPAAPLELPRRMAARGHPPTYEDRTARQTIENGLPLPPGVYNFI